MSADDRSEMDTKDKVSVQDAGRRGGTTTRERYGSEFYQRIGKKGGERTHELYSEAMREIGKKGGRPRRPELH
jgi:hypothetical protein